MKTIDVNENIHVHHIEMSKLKTTSISVCLHRPLTHDEASYNALLSSVLKQSSRLCKNRELTARYLENLYGATMGSTVLKMGEDQLIYFDCETISDRFAPNGEKLVEGLIKLVMSELFEPVTDRGTFLEDVVAHEKKTLKEKIESLINDKRSYAMLRCQEETARGTEYAVYRLGTKESLEKITPRTLFEHYRKIIVSSVIDIYICGDADIEAAARTIESYIHGIQFVKAERPKTEIITRDFTEINSVCEEMEVNQGKLAVGFITNIRPQDKDYPALMVMNSVFGAGTHSKLFANVREKLSLAYYAGSVLEKYKGMMTVNAGIEPKNYQKAYDEILAQLDEIKKGNISEYELESSIITIVNMYKSYYDDQRAMASFCLSNEIMGIKTDLEEMIEKIKAVTVDDVVRAAGHVQTDTVYFLKGVGGNADE